MGRMVYILQEDKFEAIEKAFDSLSKDHEKAMKELSKEIEKNRVLEIIKENLKYGYVFIGYDKDNKPLFQFADTKLYEEIKKHLTDWERHDYEQSIKRIKTY